MPAQAPVSYAACQGCRRDDEPLIVMMQAWCHWRWLCRWCAELVEIRHTLKLPQDVVIPTESVRR